MKIGAFLDMRNPPAWQRPWPDVAAFHLEMCEEAERVGLGSLWFSEHHGFADGYLSQPLTFAAAAAARTRTIRIGTGVLLAPLRKTVQIAEDAALVDIISNGRLDLGLGAGYRLPEFELYGEDMKARFRSLDACVAEIRALWASGRVHPRPVQQELPIWMGLHTPAGARRTGLAGLPLLAVEPDVWPAYREGLIEGGFPESHARMSGAVIGYVTDDPERDWQWLPKYLSHQWDSYAQYAVEGRDLPVPKPVNPDRMREHGLCHPSGKGILVATPENFAKALRSHFTGVPVETVFLCTSIAGMPEVEAMRHIEAMGRLNALLQ